MKILAIIFCTAALSAALSGDAYKDETLSIASDRQMISNIEKVLLKDEKGCEKTPENLSTAVLLELKIYCQAKNSAAPRLPKLKKLLNEYEAVLKNFYQNCPEVTNDEEFDMCRVLNQKVTAKAVLLNSEKEALRIDIDTMENAEKKAKDTLKHQQDVKEKENGQYLKDALKIKKETVMTMSAGLRDDLKILERSKNILTQNAKKGSIELQEKASALLKGIIGLIALNNDLHVLCSAMLRSLDAANNACNLKYSETGCDSAEANLEKKFTEGNSAINSYTSEKQKLTSEEAELNKKAVEEIAVIMEKATTQITGYLKNIEMQNDMLKQRIEFSKNDIEVLKGMENKSFLENYLYHVKTMKSLELESAVFIKRFNDFIKRISEFGNSCTINKTELTSICRETGNSIVKEVDSTMEKVSHYGAKFNRLNSDLAAFSKRVEKN